MCRGPANREVWELLRDGVAVTVHGHVHGGHRTERVRAVNWEDTAANDFLAVSQMTVTGSLYTRRPDVIGFVNGLPLVVLELKKPGQPTRQAYDGNLTNYKSDIPQLFWANALLIVSNGTESRVGSLTGDWERFFEWKRIEREDEPRRVSLEVMLRGTCDPVRLLDMVENFTLFSEHGAGLIKVIGQNHQVLGVNNAIAGTLRAREEGHGRAGVFWQTQGSGKSLAMVFYAQKILRRVPGNWSFVLVTDRVELDDQIAKTFKAVGPVSGSRKFRPPGANRLSSDAARGPIATDTGSIRRDRRLVRAGRRTIGRDRGRSSAGRVRIRRVDHAVGDACGPAHSRPPGPPSGSGGELEKAP